MNFSIKGQYQYVNPFKLKSTDPLLFATAGKIEGQMTWQFKGAERWYGQLTGASANRIQSTGIEHFATVEIKFYPTKNSSTLIGIIFLSFVSKEVKEIDGELSIIFHGDILGGTGNCKDAIGSINVVVVNGVVIEGEGEVVLPKSTL
jgi:hypothetical protein